MPGTMFSAMVGNNANSSQGGFWGPTDSLLDFCEPNYATSPYVAEFFNAFSHVPMVLYVIAGALLMHQARPKGLSSRSWAIMGVLVFVSVGSIIYHSTLRYYGQMVDELPMLFYNLVVLYHLNARSRTDLTAKQLVDWRVFLPLFSFGLAQVVVYGYLKLYAFFFVCFSGTVVLEVLQTAWAVAALRNRAIQRRCVSLMIRGLLLLFFAVAVWLIERLQCPYHDGNLCSAVMGNTDMAGSLLYSACAAVPMLHAVWHVASAQAGYTLALCLILMHQPKACDEDSGATSSPFSFKLIEVV